MDEILIVKNLKKSFEKKGFFHKKETIRAVDNVSFSVIKGQTFVLAGESGSGKTTIARLILGAIEPDSGEIIFDGISLDGRLQSINKVRRNCQMIYQDPYSAIDPRMKVVDIVREPLDIHGIGRPSERQSLVLDALRDVSLDPDEIASKYPHMLSGGQRQRVAIARAITTKPKMIIADEPVSMLDVSIRVGVLELMSKLQQRHGISFLYITHDLSTARYVGHVIAILYRGSIVEMGEINNVIKRPLHPYTQALINSIPDPYPGNHQGEKKFRINRTEESGSDKGCRFRTRCPYATEKCLEEPELEKVEEGRFVACFFRWN
ncbi:MAG: ABC transporter ATP-binding protein [Thaumarchaeota archaeon]|nr:ABC transporter ATP-binding protein [Nitrososphaerota archaeon]